MIGDLADTPEKQVKLQELLYGREDLFAERTVVPRLLVRWHSV